MRKSRRSCLEASLEFPHKIHQTCVLSGLSPLSRGFSTQREKAAEAWLCRHFARGSALDDMFYQTPRSFDEGKLVRKATLQQYTDPVIAGHVSGRDQRDIFADADVCKLLDLRKNVEVPC